MSRRLTRRALRSSLTCWIPAQGCRSRRLRTRGALTRSCSRREAMQSADHPVRVALAWSLRNPLEILAGAMLVAICAIVFAGVFFRYFLQIGLGWTEEAARYLQVWMTFVG